MVLRSRIARRTRLPPARMRPMPTRWVNVESIGSYFESLSDPRHTRNRKHLLVDIVVIAVCGMVCGCDGPTAIHRWAENRRDWLAQFLSLPNGIPSRDCIRRLLIGAQARGVSEVLPGLDHRRDPDRRLRSGPARSPSTARRVGGRTTRRENSVRCTSSAPGPARKGSPWARSRPRRNPTRSRRSPSS